MDFIAAMEKAADLIFSKTRPVRPEGFLLLNFYDPIPARLLSNGS